MRRFGELHSAPASLLLISGDINFAADLSDFRHRLVNNVNNELKFEYYPFFIEIYIYIMWMSQHTHSHSFNFHLLLIAMEYIFY